MMPNEIKALIINDIRNTYDQIKKLENDIENLQKEIKAKRESLQAKDKLLKEKSLFCLENKKDFDNSNYNEKCYTIWKVINIFKEV